LFASLRDSRLVSYLLRRRHSSSRMQPASRGDHSARVAAMLAVIDRNQHDWISRILSFGI
jgi:hypothetical protein